MPFKFRQHETKLMAKCIREWDVYIMKTKFVFNFYFNYIE